MRHLLIVVSVVCCSSAFADVPADIVAQYQKQGQTIARKAAEYLQADPEVAPLTADEKKYLTEMKQWGEALQNPDGTILDYLQNIRDVYKKLPPEESRFNDQNGFVNNMLDTGTLKPEERIPFLLECTNILAEGLEELKHAEDKPAAMNVFQTQYIQLLKRLSGAQEHPLPSKAAAQLATDFVRMLPQFRFENPPLAGLNFLETVIPVLEKVDNPELKKKAEDLTKIKRRFLLAVKPFELEAVQLDGKKINITDYRGKYVLVDFWATWCPSCRNSFPNKVKEYEKYKDKGLVVITYSVDKDVDTLRKYLDEQKFPWINVSQTLSEQSGLKNYEKFYGIWGIPTTYLLDPAGKVVFMQVESNNTQMNEALEKWVK